MRYHLRALIVLAIVVAVVPAPLTSPVRAQASCDDITVTAAQGGGGLTAAIAAANSCIGPQSIIVDPGTYTWSGASITDEVTIVARVAADPPVLRRTGMGGSHFGINNAPGPVVLRSLFVEGHFRGGLLSAVRSDVVVDRVSFVGVTTTCGISTANGARVDGGSITMTSSAIGQSGCTGIVAFNGADVVVESSEIAEMAQWGVRSTGGSVRIADSTIRDNGTSGIDVSGAGATALVVGSNVYGNGEHGIRTSSIPATIRNTVVGAVPDGAGGLVPAGNGEQGVWVFFGSAEVDNVRSAHNAVGVWLTSVDAGSTVTNSEILDNRAAGLSASGSVTMLGTELARNDPDCLASPGVIIDGGGNRDSDGTCQVVQANDPPTADVDRYTTDEDTTLVVDAPGVLDGDADPDGDALTAELVSGPTNAADFELRADGSFTFTPAQDVYGLDTFTYRASDGDLTSPDTVVQLTVRPINDAPTIAGPGPLTTDIDEPVALPIAVADVDADDPPGEGDTVVPVVGVAADGGTLLFDDTGDPPVEVEFTSGGLGPLAISGEIGDLADALSTRLSWQPDAGFVGDVAIDLVIEDRGENGVGGNLIGTDAFTVTVADLNQAPTAGPDDYSTPEDVALVVSAPGVLANDDDPDGDPIAATLDQAPTAGTVDLQPDGSFTYTPDPDANGIDTFTYRAGDGTLTSDPATVTIDVTPVSEPWTLELPDEVVTDEDTPIEFTGTLTDVDGLVQDITASSTLGVVGVVGPAADGAVTFTFAPLPNVSGTATIVIGVSDNAGGSIEIVPVTVTPVNDAPTIDGPPAVSTDEDQAITFIVNVDDVETPAADLTVTGAVVDPGAGSVAIGDPDVDGSVDVTFTPVADVNGEPLTTIELTVDDGDDTASLDVAVTVLPVDDRPEADDDAFVTDEDTPLVVATPGVLANDTDVDGEPITARLVAQPAVGTVTLDADGGFTYTPPANASGDTSFTYVAENAASASDVATVELTITPVNDTPTISGPATVSTVEDEPVSFDVTVGDVETVPGALIVFADLPAAVGAVAVDGPDATGAATLTVTPAADVTGDPAGTIVVTVTDGDAGAELLVDLVVSPVGDPPVAIADEYTTAEDTELVVAPDGVLGNDLDPDGDDLTAVLGDPPSLGSVALAPDGGFVYTPDPGVSGTDSFSYRADDGSSQSAPAVVSITIEPINDPPTIEAPAMLFGFEDRPMLVGPIVVDDVEAAAVGADVRVTVTAANGTLDDGPSVVGSGTDTIVVTGPIPIVNGTLSLFVYRPDPDHNGPDVLTYVVDDLGAAGAGGPQQATTTTAIELAPVDDRPILTVPDEIETAEDTPVSLVIGAVDPDGDPLDVAVEPATLVGSIEVTATDEWTAEVVPPADFNGLRFLSVRADDGAIPSTAIVRLVVTPVNDGPVIDSLPDRTGLEDVPEVFVVSATDVDDDPLTLDIDADPELYPAGATIQELTAGFQQSRWQVTLPPAPDRFGPSTVTATVSDGIGSASTSFTLDLLPVDDLAVAGDDSYEVKENEVLVVPAPGVLANDGDVDSDTISVVGDAGFPVTVRTESGWVELSEDGSFRYHPEGEFVGVDAFVYRIRSSDNPVAVPAVVEIRVTPVEPPTVKDTITPTDGFDGDRFGAAMAADDGRLVVLAPDDTHPVERTGDPEEWSAYVFEAVEDGRRLAAKVVASEPVDAFGRRDVALDGSIIIVQRGDALWWADTAAGGLVDLEPIDGLGEVRSFALADGRLTIGTIDGLAAYTRQGDAWVLRSTTTLPPDRLAPATTVMAAAGEWLAIELRTTVPSFEPLVALYRRTADGWVFEQELPVGGAVRGVGTDGVSVAVLDSAALSIWARDPSGGGWEAEYIEDQTPANAAVLAMDDGLVGVVSTGGNVADVPLRRLARWVRSPLGNWAGGPYAADAATPPDIAADLPRIDLPDPRDGFALDDGSFVFGFAGGAIDGVASGFVRSVALAAAPPVFGPIDDVALPPGSVRTIDIPVSDADTPIDELVLGAVSSNPAALPPDAIDIDGTLLTLSPGPLASGTTTVTLAASDGRFEATATFDVVLQENSPPFAVLTADPPVVAVGDTIVIDASGSGDADGSIVEYRWSTKDGPTVTTEPTLSLTRDAPSRRTVELTVVDDAGEVSKVAEIDVWWVDGLVVNTELEGDDTDPGDGACWAGFFVAATGEPACSLRAAVGEANAEPAPATVTVPGGDFALTSPIPVTTRVHIEGFFSLTQITGPASGPAFSNSKTLELHDVRIVGGDVGVAGTSNARTRLYDSVVAGLTGSGLIGGIVTLRDSRVSDNEALGIDARTANVRDGSTVSGNGAGGVRATDVLIRESVVEDNLGGGVSGINVTVDDSTITENETHPPFTTPPDGLRGGHGVSGAYVAVVSSDVRDNEGAGISIAFLDGSLTVTDTFVEDNAAGIQARLSEVTIERSAILRSTGAGAVIGSGVVEATTIAESGGHGLHVSGHPTGALAITNSTMSSNGLFGLYVSPSQTEIVDPETGEFLFYTEPANTRPIVESSTIVDNKYALFALPELLDDDGEVRIADARIDASRSIVGQSTDSDCWPFTQVRLRRSLGYDDTCGQPANDVDPLLGPLADNGGPTPTHLPDADSPVIEAGGVLCPVVDQRGRERPDDHDRDGRVRCDIGAVEVQHPLIVPTAAFTWFPEVPKTGRKATFAAFGSSDDGVIETYRWFIDDLPVETTNPRLKWTFESPGNHVVELEVVDDDGLTSNRVTEVVFVLPG